MAAFVVVTPTGPASAPRSESRLNIFPGAATPSVFAADMSFWIGYGFVPEAGDGDAAVHPDTRFELSVDGEPVLVREELETNGGGRTVRKLALADFPRGLPAGWHAFAARWYDEGALVLTSDRSIEFVER